jgi:hypothetical protein
VGAAAAGAGAGGGAWVLDEHDISAAGLVIDLPKGG